MNKAKEMEEVSKTFKKLRERLDISEIVDVDTDYVFSDEDGMERVNRRGVITVDTCLDYFEGLELQKVMDGKPRGICGLVGLRRVVRKTALARQSYIHEEMRDPVERAQIRKNYDAVGSLNMKLLRFYKILKRYDPRRTKSF